MGESGWLDGVFDEPDEEEMQLDREPRDVGDEADDDDATEDADEPEAAREVLPIPEFPPERDNGSSDDVIEQGEYRFLPVVGYMTGNVGADTPDNDLWPVGGKHLTWWEDKSITPKYPFMLINPVGMTTLDGDKYSFADALRLNKGEQFVLADSGGYQMSTRENGEVVESPEDHSFTKVKLYPEKIVDWQVRNADAGLVLDVPPNLVDADTKIPSNKALSHQQWLDTVFYPHMEESIDNARRMSERLEQLRDAGVPGAEDFKQMAAIHGGTAQDDNRPWKLLEEYHEGMKDAMVSIDGYAMSPQPPHSLGQMALHMAYAANRCDDVDYIHVLQGGGNTQRALLEYFAMLTDFFVSSDSSTHIRGSQWRQFYIPGTWNSEVIKITDRDDRSLERFPCRCPVCMTAEQEHGIEFLTEDSDGQRAEIMSMHNLHQSFISARVIASLIRKYGADVVEGLEVENESYTVVEEEIGNEGDALEPNQFWEIMTNKYSDKHIINLWRAMSFLRTAVEDGLEATLDEGWYIPWDSRDTGDEWEIQHERSAMDW